MYVRRNIRPSLILWFCWKEVIFFIALSSIVYWLYSHVHCQWLAVPFLPVGTIGTAVAFYIGFKNNSSYERLWEGRKIWASITNLSRYWGMLVSAIHDDEISPTVLTSIKQRLIRRQLDWCNVLRLQLRQTADYWNPERLPPEAQLMRAVGLSGEPQLDYKRYLADTVQLSDRPKLQVNSNPASALLQIQLEDILQLNRENQLPDLQTEQMANVINECIKEQGSCERIKTFPFPRQYAYFSGVYVWIFLLLLPFSLLSELPKSGAVPDWMMVPFSTLLSWIFLTMEQVGDTSEDPFSMSLNDVPITAICRNIEIELLEMLGETELPPKVMPVTDILL